MAEQLELHPYEIEQRRNIQIIKNAIPRVGLTEDVLKDLGDICLSVRQQVPDFDRSWWFSVSRYVKANALQLANTTGESIFMERYYNACLFEAPDIFESYMVFTESGRPFEKQFYAPRVRPLRKVADALQGLEDRKYEFLGVSEPPRTGKALAYDTPVLTRDGWKNHGDLTTEDEVIGLDGKFKKVLAVHNPCRMEYKVNFSDGESIVCHGNHEWYVFDRHAQDYRTIETADMVGKECDYHGKKRRFRFQVPEKDIVVGKKKGLAVDPYMLGVWLGDGRNTNPDICGPECDYAIVQKILDNGYEISWQTVHKTTGVHYYGFKDLRSQLQLYGMCYSKMRTIKHIPEEYLTASIEQRLWLLAGLLDTDGTLMKKDHRYQFSTTEPQLRDDFVTLVSSFGWRCCVVSEPPKVSSSGVHGRKTVYSIGFNPTMEIPCQVERKQLHEFSKPRRIGIESIEPIEGEVWGNCITVEGGIYLVGKTLKPTHNSTICIFFLSWIIGKRPNSHNAMAGHSGFLADGFYEEILTLTTSPEYRFLEVFPNAILESKSAEKNEANYGERDRFPTFVARGIDGTWTGEVDISPDGYLYVDDLVRDRTESLNPRRLETRYQDYLNVLVDRKNDGSRELMVGTRWNVQDPLGRVEQAHKDDPRYHFLKLPALDENDESNFDYPIKGFSTKYYLDMRDRLDKPEWEAKYQQRPFIREGLLFPADELRYYNGTLPEGDFRVVSACDVAWGSGDSLSMPVGYEYENGDVYIPKWVFSKGVKEVTLPEVTGAIISEGIKQINFEANAGGDMYAQYVSEMLEGQGYRCAVTHSRAPSTMDKMTKIIASSGNIKRRYVFLDAQHQDEEYRAAMAELNMFVQIGKNEHDDAADGLSQLDRFLEGQMMATVEPMRRRF